MCDESVTRDTLFTTTIMDGGDASANASRLYVGNIPWSTTVEDLRDLFADCGGVRDVDIPTGRQGRSRGYGIVEFTTEADALAAVSRMDGTWGAEASDRGISRDRGSRIVGARRRETVMNDVDDCL